MIKKLALGNRFALLAILVLFITFFLEYLFRNKIVSVPVEHNFLVIQFVAIAFFGILVLAYLLIFRNILFVAKFSLRSLVLLSLFLMLVSTVLSMKLSIYITVFFSFSAILYGFKNKQFQPHPLFYFIVAYYLFQLLGLIWSVNFLYGFKYIGKGLSYLLIPLAFSAFRITNEERGILLRTFFRFLLVYIFMNLIAYLFQVIYSHSDLLIGIGLTKNYFGKFFYPMDTFYVVAGWSGFSHPTFISFILCVMTGLGFYLWKIEKEKINRISNFELLFFAILSFLLIVILQSRIGMILFPVTLFLIILYNFRKSKMILISIVVFSFIVLILGYFFLLKQHMNYFYDEARVKQTEIVVAYLKDHFWIGTGTGGMKVINQGYPTAHNQLLGELFHLGIGGLLVFLSMFTASVYYAVKNRNYNYLLVLILLFLLMQIEMPFSLQKGITFYTLFTGLLIRPDFKSE